MRPSAIVLAGGMSRRLGRNKAIELVGGQPLLHRVLSRVAQIASDTVVVLASQSQAEDLSLPLGVNTALDIYPGKGSLGGIYTGLSAVRNQWALVVSCDMPFLNIELLNEMWHRNTGFDAVVPVLDGRPEPTHAFYSKVCLPHIQGKLESGDLKIARFFDSVNVNFMPQSDVENLDPQRLSFFNVNTQEDLDRALDLVSREQQ